MLKLNRTKSGMRILTVKALGFYANLSFGRSARKAPVATKVPHRHENESFVNALSLIALEKELWPEMVASYRKWNAGMQAAMANDFS